MPWFWPALLALLASGVWLYRVSQVRAADPEELVRTAWAEGRKVALEGRQKVQMAGAGGKLLQVDARVMTSPEGQVKIEYLSEPLAGVTVWENGQRTYRFNPKLERLTVATKRGTPEDLERQELQLLQNYDARVAGRERIAGRTAVLVELRPRSRGDLWKRVAIDPETGVILASEDRRGEREVLRSIRFTEVRYLPPGQETPESAFRPSAELLEKYGTARPGDTSSRFEPEALSRLIGFEVRVPTWVPKGYIFRGAYQTPCTCSVPHQAARLEYSDGLNTITLFQCGHPDCVSRKNCFADGETPLAERARIGRTWYLAVGDVPREDLRRLIQSAAGETQ